MLLLLPTTGDKGLTVRELELKMQSAIREMGIVSEKFVMMTDMVLTPLILPRMPYSPYG